MTLKILVAEDSATMRRVMELAFAGVDAQLVTVDSAEAALKRLADFEPDVVLADGSLGGTDGYELAREIKAHSATLPVILLCSQFHPYDAGRATSSGVDDYINKPFDSQILIDKTKKLVASGAKAGAPVSIAAEPKRAKPASPKQKQPVSEEFDILQEPTTGKRAQHEVVTGSLANPEPPSQRMTAAHPPSSVPGMAASAQRAQSDMAERLAEMGLSPDQAEGVLRLSAEVVERVVWEVVPELAEALIREEIRRLTSANPAE